MIEEIKNHLITTLERHPNKYEILDKDYQDSVFLANYHCANDGTTEFMIKIIIDDNNKIHLILINEESSCRDELNNIVNNLEESVKEKFQHLLT